MTVKKIYPENEKELRKILEKETLQQVKDFCATALIAAAIGQDVFRRRFPKEYEAWDREIDEL